MVMLGADCSPCCPETGFCVSACSENYSAIHVRVWHPGSPGGAVFTSPRTIFFSDAPTVACEPLLSAVLNPNDVTFVIDRRSGPSGFTTTTGSFAQPNGGTETYTYSVNRTSSGRICGLQFSYSVRMRAFTNASLRESASRFVQINPTSGTFFSEASIGWLGLPVTSGNSNNLSQVWQRTSSAATLSCQSNTAAIGGPGTLRGQSGNGPGLYGGVYGDNSQITAGLIPGSFYIASYFRRVPPINLTVTYV